jgi:hypothetical protein
MCSYIPFKAVEAFLVPVLALTYFSETLLFLVSCIIVADWMNSYTPDHPQQLILPGFEPKVGCLQRWFSWILTSLKRLLEEITTVFWTLFAVLICGTTTLMMSTLSWIIYAHVLCPLPG